MTFHCAALNELQDEVKISKICKKSSSTMLEKVIAMIAGYFCYNKTMLHSMHLLKQLNFLK